MKKIVLGGGCFWCVEAVFQQVKDVSKVVSGYAGGTLANPNYRNIGDHAEVVEVSYNEKQIDLKTILRIFLSTHDPTQVNRQGNDVGTQYRSAIFYHSDKQRQVAEKSKKDKDEKGVFHSPIVTEISKIEKFYPAEKYHQDYYRNNKAAPYCRFVITPKLDKLGLEK